MRYPLTWQDQAILDLESASDPWNIQFEIGVAGRIDPTRLEQALIHACRRHPIASARIEYAQGLASTSYRVPEQVDRIDTGLRTCETEADLAATRTAFYSAAFDLRQAPPFKIMIVRRAEGDLLLFNVAHPVVDGIGLLRFLATVTRFYRGVPDPADPLPLEQARDLERILRPGTAAEASGRAWEGGRKLIGSLKNPSRIAPDSQDERNAAGFTHRVLAPEVLQAIAARKPAGTTINDVLLGAVALTVQRWNRGHGVGADKVQIFMPVSVRPAEWSTEIVSNLFSYVSVTSLAAQRADLMAAAAAASEQTAPLKRAARSGGTQDLLRLITPLPRVVKQNLPHLLTATGNRFVDTAVVSNLGRPAEVPSFAETAPPEVNFTPPYWSAAAISVGAISVAGSLRLGLRHRLSVLDAGAGARFADLLVSTLTSTPPTTSAPPTTSTKP